MKLNSIEDVGAENLRQFHEKRIGADIPAPRRYRAHQHLGLLAWRGGDIPGMNQHLTAAAKEAINIFSAGDSDIEKSRQPRDFDMPLMLTLLFGDDALKERLRRLPRSAWSKDGDEEYAALAGLFDVLRMFSERKTVDRAAIQKVLADNSRPESQSWYKPWIQAMGDGLLAIADGDKTRTLNAIKKLVDLHEKEARQGDWKQLVEGLLATWAMVLFRFARASGMDIEFESPYFPAD